MGATGGGGGVRERGTVNEPLGKIFEIDRENSERPPFKILVTLLIL
jgi:hypothetical protein